MTDLLLDGVLAVTAGGPAELESVAARAAALRRFYAPLGMSGMASHRVEGPGVLVLAIGPRVESTLDSPVTWGRRLPAWLHRRRALASCGDGALRGLSGPLAAVEWDDDAACLVVAPDGVCSLYETRGPGEAQVWASHAVAAAHLAGLDCTLDPLAIAQVVTTELVGGRRSLLSGVEPVCGAQRIRFEAGSRTQEDFWAAAERWRPPEAREAEAVGRRALEEHLGRRLDGAQDARLGLTAGLDSQVAAVAVRRVGAAAEALTYGGPGDADVVGAERAAATLGMTHRRIDRELWGDDRLEDAIATARFSDGAAPAWLGGVCWPADVRTWTPGLGGETGRGFYWRWAVRDPRRHPREDEVDRALLLRLRDGAVGAGAVPLAALEDEWHTWLAQARGWGLSGWSVLDAVYAEHRVRRWGRALAPRLGAELVGAFAAAPVQAALAALPVEARITSAFQRRYLAEHAHAIAPPPVPAQPAGRHTLRRRALVQRLRGLRRRAGVPDLRRGGPAWHEHPPFSALPRYVGFMRAALADPLIAEALGERWQQAALLGFDRGDPGASHAAEWATGPVALSRELRQLRQAPRNSA